MEEEAPVNDFGRTVPSPRNKFSSLPNTIVAAVFPNLYLWRRTLCSNLGGIDPQHGRLVTWLQTKNTLTSKKTAKVTSLQPESKSRKINQT